MYCSLLEKLEAKRFLIGYFVTTSIPCIYMD